jgi:hypothetical protein
MDIKKTINEALAQPLDRRQFLFHLGALFFALIGITSLLSRLGLTREKDSTPGSAYGGHSRGGFR